MLSEEFVEILDRKRRVEIIIVSVVEVNYPRSGLAEVLIELMSVVRGVLCV